MTSEALRNYLLEQGASDVGFSRIDDGDFGDCRYAVSVVVRLSDAVVDEINSEPTHTYFHHYRTVNALIDQLLLKAGLFLQKEGFRYITVAASQSVNKSGWNYCGRYSHKKAACLAGLGTVGKNSLFLHREFGPRVRLGTVMTDCPLPCARHEVKSVCGSCRLCMDACPAKAILGGEWGVDVNREQLFDPAACSEYMKKNFQQIGRGAVCGICMRVCPKHG